MIYIIPVVLIIVGALAAFGGIMDANAAKYIPQQTLGYMEIFGGLTIVAISYSAMMICSKIDALIAVQKKADASGNSTHADATLSSPSQPQGKQPSTIDGLLQSQSSSVNPSFGTPAQPQQNPPAMK